MNNITHGTVVTINKDKEAICPYCGKLINGEGVTVTDNNDGQFLICDNKICNFMYTCFMQLQSIDQYDQKELTQKVKEFLKQTDFTEHENHFAHIICRLYVSRLYYKHELKAAYKRELENEK